MDAQQFLSQLLDVLPDTWAGVDPPPRTPGDYSTHIFSALAEAADQAEMQYRGHGHEREVLFDGLWLPGKVSNYRLPQVVIEHENGTKLEDILYDLRKVMMAWAPVRVMFGYAQREQDPYLRVAELEERIKGFGWTYPPGCEDLILIGPYLMPTPRSYLVLYRPPGVTSFAPLEVPGLVAPVSAD